jgi:hypothetical protein
MIETLGAGPATEKGTALPSASTRIHPPPRSRTRPEADSWLGQNCGGHRLARVASLDREEHVCLFCSLLQIRARNVAVFGTDVLLCDGNINSGVSKQIKQINHRHIPVAEKFLVSWAGNSVVAPAYRISPPPHRVNTRCVSSGDHPRSPMPRLFMNPTFNPGCIRVRPLRRRRFAGQDIEPAAPGVEMEACAHGTQRVGRGFAGAAREKALASLGRNGDARVLPGRRRGEAR